LSYPSRLLIALVNEELGYPIVVGEDLRVPIARFAAQRASPVVLLCDENPAVTAVANSIAVEMGGCRVLRFTLGERNKRMATVEGVLDALLTAGADRRTLAIGVGGGVASDLFGFAAATYMRGVSYAHVATTLTAMVDAAIGGKTGVDLERGKNLAGTFSDPVAVFCPVAALETLPFASLREGLAEIVKAGIIEGAALFDALEELSPHPFSHWPWMALIQSAIKVKTGIVAADRHESGRRELLNLGHTFAHAIESASAYRITHGAAVAIGLRGAGLLALRTGRFTEREHLRVLTLLTLLGMPLRTSADAGAVFRAMRSDKKRLNGQMRFVLPRSIGDVEYGVECAGATVRAVLARLQRAPAAVRR
jgi:shikimate kinase/3-dehydroquinate synthase